MLKKFEAQLVHCLYYCTVITCSTVHRILNHSALHFTSLHFTSLQENESPTTQFYPSLHLCVTVTA
jgi:hypothetical protein